MVENIGATFGYGSLTNDDRLKAEGMMPGMIVPVLLKPQEDDAQLIRAYGLSATTDVQDPELAARLPTHRRTLGVYQPGQIGSDFKPFDGYRVSGVITPLELKTLGESENKSTTYTLETIPRDRFVAFYKKDVSKLEDFLAGHPDVHINIPGKEYSPVNENERVPLSYLAVVAEGAMRAAPTSDFPRHVIGATYGLDLVDDDVTELSRENRIYSKARSEGAITEESVRFVQDLLNSRKVDVRVLKR